MIPLGTALSAAAGMFLAREFWRARRSHPFPLYGVVGLLSIVAAEILLALEVRLVAAFFTPINWTGYILAIDGAVYALRGRSLVASDRAALGWMALLSIPLWLVFEAYNLRLRNWVYAGLPENVAVRSFGYAWSFATIWPAILGTADFLLATRFRAAPRRAPDPAAPAAGWLVPAGAVLLILPAALPPDWGAYLFGMVWLGFVLLLDPLNYREGRPSILGDLRARDRGRLAALLVAGIVCGFFWEFWNYRAAARWLYTFPILQQAKIFEMPAPGYLGFPPFAVEVFVMYVYAAGKLGLPCHHRR